MKKSFKISLFLFNLLSLLFTHSIHATGKVNPPILILGSPGHFDGYTGEILKAEGFNEFQIDSLNKKGLSLRYLQQFDIVILTEALLTDQQANILVSYVKDGGNLVAFRPDKKIAAVFGINDRNDTLPEAYIAIDSISAIGKDLLTQTLQVHGATDLFQLNGSAKIASLYRNANDPTDYPAVTLNNYGLGYAIAFMYNLPRSIALTRQGNPRLAGQEKDGIKGIRAMDMFVNGWVDTSKNILNQADEQMRLLTHCIESLSAYRKPLPRFWYFPDSLNCLVALTNDGEFRNEADFETQFRDIESKGANMGLYVLKMEGVSRKSSDAWQQRGHEISGHPDDTKEAEQPTWMNMNNAIRTKLDELNSRLGITGMNTVVNHWFVWCGRNEQDQLDFTAQAKIEAVHHIGLDINYAHYDNNSVQPRFLGPLGTRQGNFNGTGLPLRFVDEGGNLVNIYQLLNDVYDQQYMENKDSVGFYECFKGLLDRSIHQEVYSCITIKAHNDEYFFSKTALLKMLDYAKENAIPVWTPRKLLDFIMAKDEARFRNIKWAQHTLSFAVESPLANENKFGIMIPRLFAGKKIKEIYVDGKKSSCFIKPVKGAEYAFLAISTGATHTVEVRYAD